MESADSSGHGNREARAAPRYPVRWPVRLRQGEAVTRDISASGMYLESEVELVAGDAVEFDVILPRHRGVTEILHCLGRAVRVERLGAHFGLGVSLNSYRFVA